MNKNKKINKKKMMPIIISASALGLLGVGCAHFNNKEILFDETKVIKIEDSEDDNTYDKYRFSYSENTDTLKEYDKIELTSYTTNFDENKLEYIISLGFKNISDKSLNKLKINFTAVGPDSSLPIKEVIDMEEIAANKEFNYDITISKDDLLALANNYTQEEETVAKSIISNLIKNKEISLIYNYNYTNSKKSGVNIKHELDTDGTIFNSAVYSTVKVDKELKSSYVENDSYLNFVKPEEKYDNQLIETQNIKIDIDKNFNFTISAKFKNISDKTIDAFRFEPSIIIGDTYAPDVLNKEIVVKNSIKSGEEFDINVTYKKDIIQECLEYLNIKDLNIAFYKNEDKLLRYLVKNRLVSVSYTYDYENTDMAASVKSTISRSGKLDVMEVREYNVK